MFNGSKADSHPDWIVSCVEQSVVASSWKKVESKAGQILSQKLEKEMADPVQRQVLFQLLGKDLVQKHFQNYTNDPSVLDDLSAKKLEKKSGEMLSLATNILETASEGKSSKGKKSKFSEYGAFLQDTKEIVDSEVGKPSKSKKSKKGKYSVEDTMADILGYDASMIKHFTTRAQSESLSLPSNLRIPLWAEYLTAKEATKSRGFENFEKSRKKFMKLQNTSEMDESYASSSGFSFKITKSVQKIYKQTENLKSVSSELAIEETSEILQLCSKYTQAFRHHHSFWAVPMQQIYSHNKSTQEEEEESDSLLATVALLLEKTLRLCAPHPDQLFSIASKVMESIEQSDKELVTHMKLIASKNVPVSSTDFPSDVIFNDKKKGAAALQTLSESTKEIPEDLKKTITRPEIFIRKWIFEGFVSILTPIATLFVWDQLFLCQWDSQAIQDVCLTLLGLLKPWFILAKDFGKLREVFLEEPGKLYTLDIKRAWQHMKKKGKFRDLAKMNRNIIFTDAPPKPPTPRAITPPPPPPPRVPTPRLPTPKVPTPILPVTKFIPWVPYGKDKAKQAMPVKMKVDLPFDLYVDSVRFIPDNSTVTKVTGKILNMYLGRRESARIQAFPKLDSFFRYPQFEMKEVVNKERQPMNPDVVMMFRVYTIEVHSKKPVILGSCLFCPFSNKDGKQATLRAGGHQIRLRYGVPDPDFTVEHMLASHMDDNALIPGATILIRVLPHGQEYVSAPEYESNMYRSEFARPNESEKRLYTHYQNSKNFKSTIRDVARTLPGMSSTNDEALDRSIQALFDKEGSGALEFPYERYVHYDRDMGAVILADKVAGLPIFLEGRYLQCLVQYFPGQDTRKGNGRTQVKSFLTEDLDLDSSQRAPDWTDRPTKINPEYDERGYIFVALYGLRPRYDPDKKRVLDKDGKEPKFDLQHSIAWSVVPLFEKGAVFAGSHIVPLIKGRPPDNIEEKLAYLPFDFVCQKFKSAIKIFDSASIEITVWDGRFTDKECPPLPIHTKYLNISPNPKKYLVAKKQKFGDTVMQLIRSGLLKPVSLTDNIKMIVLLLKRSFKENMNRALRNAGFSELLGPED